MAAELIGACRCPVCKSDKARLTLAKSKLVVLTCNACNFQGFAHSGRSDELLRDALIVNAPAPAEPPAAPPANPPEPVRTEKPPAAHVRPQPAAPARTGGLSWGMLRG